MPLKNIPMLQFFRLYYQHGGSAKFRGDSVTHFWRPQQTVEKCENFFWHVLRNDGQLLGLYTIDGNCSNITLKC